MTPGYVDKEELEGEGLGGGGRTYMPPQHQPEETPEENPTDENRTVPVFRVWWLLAALGCLLLVLAALLAARRLRLRRRLAEIAAAEDKAAIALRFAYAAWLMATPGRHRRSWPLPGLIMLRRGGCSWRPYIASIRWTRRSVNGWTTMPLRCWPIARTAGSGCSGGIITGSNACIE